MFDLTLFNLTVDLVPFHVMCALYNWKTNFVTSYPQSRRKLRSIVVGVEKNHSEDCPGSAFAEVYRKIGFDPD